nr:hypothetical protein Iba_scaffold37474CG0020 [Ipomoea batatas]
MEGGGGFILQTSELASCEGIETVKLERRRRSEIEEGKESRLVRFNGTGTEHINEGRHGVTEETAVPLGSLGESPDLPGRPDFGIRVVRLDEPESLSHNTRRAGGRRQWRRSGCFRIAIGIYIVGAGR